MIHAFLRNVFWIVPLFLVLVSDASSPCMDDIRSQYDNMLSIDITNLEDILQNTSDFRGRSCNSTKENTTGQNAAVCTCCCKSNTTKALSCMARCLKKISETCITSRSQLQHRMSLVSNWTLKLLLHQECNTTVVKKTQKGKCCRCRDFYQTSDMIIYTKKLFSDFNKCWIHFIRTN
nr:PREDICTED: uncharacterized protein LOC103278502 isoform X2 [Anolis carolinensis]|eukprot:XP_008106675.1 PREDICTED: uncharacterized protein LOC103278502 isoform X2 [Anolis carolinensis]